MALAPLLQLLCCICFAISPALARENATVLQRPVVQANASARASANAGFTSLWQINGAATELGKLTLDVPGRVFVSHAPSVLVSAESAAEINVSGSSEDVVKAVGVYYNNGSMSVSTTRKPLAGEYLLIEVALRKKNSVRKVFSDGPGDVVVEQGVLASSDASMSGSRGRRLQQDPTSALTSTASFASSGAAAGFVIDEVASNSKGGSDDTIKARTWMIRRTGGPEQARVDIGLAAAGAAIVDQVRGYNSGEPYAGRVMVLGENVARLDQVEVVVAAATPASGAQSLQVRLKASASAGPTPSNFTTIVGLTPASLIGAVVAENVRVREMQKDGGSTGEVLQIANSGEGTVFIAAAKSAIVASSVSLTTHKTGGIQVELGALWTSDMLSLASISSGAILFHGESISSQITASPSAVGRICVAASHNLTGVSVAGGSSADDARTKRVSFTGKTSGATAATCVKLSVPARVPAETLASTSTEIGADGSSGTSQSSSSAAASARASAACVALVLAITGSMVL